MTNYGGMKMLTSHLSVPNIGKYETESVELSQSELALIDQLIHQRIFESREAFLRAAVAALITAHRQSKVAHTLPAFPPGLDMKAIRYC
jgi:Arc/MetJ-type ribon-helix-helix transcriptional regulator